MQGASTPGLPLRGRAQTYTMLVGVVVVLLIVGLGIPFVFGTPLGKAGGAPQVAETRF